MHVTATVKARRPTVESLAAGTKFNRLSVVEDRSLYQGARELPNYYKRRSTTQGYLSAK